jgi:hypothetical protein
VVRPCVHIMYTTYMFCLNNVQILYLSYYKQTKHMHAWSNTLQRRQKAKLLTDLWAPLAQ